MIITTGELVENKFSPLEKFAVRRPKIRRMSFFYIYKLKTKVISASSKMEEIKTTDITLFSEKVTRSQK